ncbi:hypothetical protein Asp14428_23140 [Actinoplanes sp. NBRC 14428]|nr:STAS domain-containing protein [Pseudosporangium ferrugineum]BCJ50839.1 hypothetical protein Asp14428_23140 [Actinoplanes sp. NBRC 14428]
MAHFEATTSAADGTVIVALSGECDLEGRDRLTAVLHDAVATATPVVVDLAGVTFIDSSGIHGLVVAHHAAQRAGSRLHLVNASGPVATVLEMTGVDRLLAPPPAAGPARTEDAGHA